MILKFIPVFFIAGWCLGDIMQGKVNPDGKYIVPGLLFIQVILLIVLP